jgi:hypothetical protein
LDSISLNGTDRCAFASLSDGAVPLQAGILAVEGSSDANSEEDEQSCSYRKQFSFSYHNKSSLHAPKQRDSLWE